MIYVVYDTSYNFSKIFGGIPPPPNPTNTEVLYTYDSYLCVWPTLRPSATTLSLRLADASAQELRGMHWDTSPRTVATQALALSHIESSEQETRDIRSINE